MDGGIIGPAARKRGTTRLYLSGPAAPEVAVLFSAGPIDAIVLDAPAGAASALKMEYAGWTKDSSALLAAIRAFAMAEDVDSALLSEWKISQPDVPARSERAFTDARLGIVRRRQHFDCKIGRPADGSPGQSSLRQAHGTHERHIRGADALGIMGQNEHEADIANEHRPAIVGFPEFALLPFVGKNLSGLVRTGKRRRVTQGRLPRRD